MSVTDMVEMLNSLVHSTQDGPRLTYVLVHYSVSGTDHDHAKGLFRNSFGAPFERSAARSTE